MELFDTWWERIGLPSGVGLTLRLGWWLLQRRRGKATGAPLIDWIARRMVVETALYLKEIELKVEQAENRRLRELMRDAGIPSGSDASADSSFDLPESTLVRSKRTTGGSNAGTSRSPDGDPT
jgi:hypothetical protein